MLISAALIGDDKQSNYSEKGRDLVGAATGGACSRDKDKVSRIKTF